MTFQSSWMNHWYWVPIEYFATPPKLPRLPRPPVGRMRNSEQVIREGVAREVAGEIEDAVLVGPLVVTDHHTAHVTSEFQAVPVPDVGHGFA